MGRGKRKIQAVKVALAAPNDIRVMEAPSAMRAQIDTGSPILQRTNFGRRAGLSYRSQLTGQYHRDLYEALGYEERLTPELYRARYERGGVAERLIEAFPKATWGGGVKLVEDPDPEVETPFEEATRLLATRLNLWGQIQRADILAGLGHYAVLLIGAKGALESPLPRMPNSEALLYLTPLPESRAQILAYDEKSESPRYGMPEVYTLTLATNKQTQRVHWTRIVHIAEGTLETPVLGRPRLRSVWNYLDDLDKIVGGGAEAAWKRMDPGMQVDLDAEAEMSEGDEAKLDEEIDEYQHGLRRVMRTRGAKINLLTAPVAGFGPNVSSVLSLISATVGIPIRILIGSERGELASTQDRANWADRVTERRLDFATPMVRLLIDRLVDAGALPAPSAYEVEWPDIEELNEHEKVTVVNSMTSSNTQQMAAEGKLVMTSDEIRSLYLDLDPSDETEVEMDVPDTLPQDGPPETGDKQPAASGEDDESEANADSASSADQGRALRALSPAFSRLGGVFVSQWATASRNLDQKELARLLAQGNPTGAVQSVLHSLAAAERTTQLFLEPALRDAVLVGMRIELSAVRSLNSWRTGSSVDGSVLTRLARHPYLGMALDEEDSRISDYSRRRTVSLLSEVNEETRAAIAALIVAAIHSGISQTRLVSLIAQYIGLRDDQMVSLVDLEARLTAAKPGDIVHAGPVRVKVGPVGLSLTRIRSITADYEMRLRSQRARLIARTEGSRAANVGQEILWLQALNHGELPPTQKKKWITRQDEKVRESHRPLHGQVRALNEPFKKGDGSNITPGAEWNCRCTQILVFGEEGANA